MVSNQPAAGPEIELVDFDAWFDALFTSPDGKPLSPRTKRKHARDFRLPIIKVGWERKINPAAGNRALAEHAAYQQREQPPRRRGRPRTNGS